MGYQKTLSQELESKDNKLFSRLDRIRDTARKLLSYTSASFPTYTPHDFGHSESVEELLSDMLPDEVRENLSPYELFVLIVSAWLHDWGMISDGTEDPELVRHTHHLRTERFCEENFESVHLNEHEGLIVGLIAKGHRKVDLHNSEYDNKSLGNCNIIRVRFLAALLRMADEFDITNLRTPYAIFKTIKPTGKSKDEFMRHLSISGVAFVSNKHKLEISAVARHQSAAAAVRTLQESIQVKLNEISDILKNNNVPLEYVQAKIDAKGFIDKPIAFAVNKERVVDLLIGTHLYEYRDVAIRELVQNAIDACRVNTAANAPHAGLIEIKRIDANTLEISDNGIGMDFDEAKAFLSEIGTSYYGSGKYKESCENKEFQPISQYGIGILSCFLICSGMVIETQKKGSKGCKFTIDSHRDEWNYQDYSRELPGTTIRMLLNEHGRELRIRDALNKYLLCPDVDINISDFDGEIFTFKNRWSDAPLATQFIRNRSHVDSSEHEVVLERDINGASYILVSRTNSWDGGIILFNHGIFVCNIDVPYLRDRYYLYVNIKAPIVDLTISRESVVKNDKYKSFVYSVFSDIFAGIKEKYLDSDVGAYFRLVGSMLESRIYSHSENVETMVNEDTMLQAALEHIQFPLFANDQLSFGDFSQVLRQSDSVCYHSRGYDFMLDLELIKDCFEHQRIAINPFSFPKFYTGIEESVDMLRLYTDTIGIQCSHFDFRDLLIQTFKKVDVGLSFPNVEFGVFTTNYKPFVLYSKFPVFKRSEYYGTAYYGCISLVKSVAKDTRMRSLVDYLNTSDSAFSSVSIVDEPIIAVDCEDQFVSNLISLCKDNPKDIELHELVLRYFSYIKFFPLMLFSNDDSPLFYEAIYSIESFIINNYGFNEIAPLHERIRPNLKRYVTYYARSGPQCDVV